MFKQCSSEAAYLVSTNVFEQEEVWEQSEVAAGFLLQQAEAREELAFLGDRI